MIGYIVLYVILVKMLQIFMPIFYIVSFKINFVTKTYNFVTKFRTMKKLLLSFLLCLYSSIYAQVSIGHSHNGDYAVIKETAFTTFKNTTTVFVLSEALSNSFYQKILDEVWTVTPYKLVSKDDFVIENYNLDTTSFAILTGQINTIVDPNLYGKTTYDYFIYIDFFMYKSALKKKEIELYNKMPTTKKEAYNIESKHKDYFARINLMPTKEVAENLKNNDIKSINIYKDKAFFNYTPGSLLNYFQFVNRKFIANESFGMNKNIANAALKNLKTEVLYIPSSLVNYLREPNSKLNDNEILATYFKDYPYKYEIIDENQLSYKIMDNHQLYYFRYYNFNDNLYLQIVNSIDGDIIYSSFETSKKCRLKAKDFEVIANEITKMN